MADRDTKVFEMVERELKKDPKVSGAVLQEKARSINKEEAELSPRSFNARGRWWRIRCRDSVQLNDEHLDLMT